MTKQQKAIGNMNPAYEQLLNQIRELREENERLRHVLVGEKKARELLLKGMESQCEQSHDLKQDNRRLTAEVERLYMVASMLEEIKDHKCFKADECGHIDHQDCLGSIFSTIFSCCRRAAEVLAAEEKQ